MSRPLNVYIAGKVSKNSSFGRFGWRDDFCTQLADLSGMNLKNLDPTTAGIDQGSPQLVFGYDSYLISQSDVVVVYLSDDISVGGSQEILIAKHFEVPVIGFAPYGGKFNGCTKEYADSVVEDYKDPFVFTSCDMVCGTVEEVGKALRNIKKITPKTLSIIQESIDYWKQNTA